MIYNILIATRDVLSFCFGDKKVCQIKKNVAKMTYHLHTT